MNQKFIIRNLQFFLKLLRIFINLLGKQSNILQNYLRRVQLLLIIDHIVPLIKNHNRVMEIDSNTISNIAAENRSVGKTNDVTLLYEISRGIVRTEVMGVAELIRILNIRIEKLFYGQIVKEMAFGVIENVLTAL